MSENKENIPQGNWRKPATSIKLVVKKRARSNSNKPSKLLDQRNLNLTKQDSQFVRQTKRQNPFGCSLNKRINTGEDKFHEENTIFNALETPASRSTDNSIINAGICSELIGVSSKFDVQKPGLSSLEEDGVKLRGEILPFDWSLMTRVRFVSPQPFTCCAKVLGKQESKGLCNFVKSYNPDIDDDSTVCFRRNSMYWIHPNLPWVSLFPRLASEIKLTSKIPNVAENEDIRDVLHQSWCKSFHSLFNLLRCGYCDYFYLCSAHFTLLFRSATIAGIQTTYAYITPTTKGMREGLDREGIKYVLPVLTCKPLNHGDDDLVSNDIENEKCWLESMGVAEDTLPQLQKSKISEQLSKLRNIDHQSSSVAVVHGNHTQALFNFLLNSKTLISKTGSHAGLPPTLLAPVAFEGATLQSLNSRLGTVKFGKSLEKHYSLDITGPILPGNFSNLCYLFKRTQQQFSAAINSVPATAPFNLSLEDEEKQIKNEENLQNKISKLKMNNLTFITFNEQMFTWKTS